MPVDIREIRKDGYRELREYGLTKNREYRKDRDTMPKKIEYREPAKSVIAALGGVEKVAEITGKHVSNVYRWMYPRGRGGTDGFIPQADAEKLLDHARRQSLPVTADSFFRRAA